MTTRFRVPAPRSARTLSRSADSSCSGKRALQGQGRALGQRPHVAGADPRHQVVGQAMGLLVGPGDDDDRPRRRKARAADGKVRRPGGGGHTKDARLRQMGPKGVDERCDAAITAARRGHAAGMVPGTGQAGVAEAGPSGAGSPSQRAAQGKAMRACSSWTPRTRGASGIIGIGAREQK